MLHFIRVFTVYKYQFRGSWYTKGLQYNPIFLCLSNEKDLFGQVQIGLVVRTRLVFFSRLILILVTM